MYWCYYGYDHHYWNHCWYPKRWGTYYIDYHYYYDFVDTFPNIYLAPSLALDPTSQAIAYLEEGAELFRNGEYLEALHKFLLATLADLDFAVPKFAYAQALFALGVYDYAAYQIRLGLSLLPEWLEIGGDIKLMYGDVAHFEEQLAALITHIRVWPADEDAILVLGYVSFFSGDLYMADKVFKELSTSLDQENQFVAGLFLTAIDQIKVQIQTMDPNSSLLQEDDVTLKELLKD
jgi:tetratricopeptide (TPR) repeat protein